MQVCAITYRLLLLSDISWVGSVTSRTQAKPTAASYTQLLSPTLRHLCTIQALCVYRQVGLQTHRRTIQISWREETDLPQQPQHHYRTDS